MERIQHQYRALSLAGACAAVLTTIVMGAIEWRTRSSVTESASWVAHTLQVEKEFGTLLNAITDAETGERGYLLTASAAYLEPYTSADAAFAASMARLRTLTADNPQQQQRLQQLDSVARTKLREVAQAVDRMSSGNRDGALEIVSAHQGRQMADVRRLVREGIAEEERLLVDRTRVLDNAITRRGYWMWSFVALNAVVLLVLLAVTARLRRQSLMATVCAESRTIRDDDQWITFDEYLHRRFGVDVTHGMSPDAAQKISENLAEMQITDRH